MPARLSVLAVGVAAVLLSVFSGSAAQSDSPAPSCVAVYDLTVSALNGASPVASGSNNIGDLPTGVMVRAGDRVDYISHSTPTSWCTYCENAAGADNVKIDGINVMALAFRYGNDASDKVRAHWAAVFAYFDPPVSPQTNSFVVPSSVVDTEQLWLAAWDNAISDNYGSVQVTVTVTPATCNPGGVNGDPVFIGFGGQKFLVDGQPQRVYNLLSLPALQLNTRFIPLAKGQAMNVTEQRSVYKRQSKLIAALRKAATADSDVQPLPATTTWSHAGLYMGETAVQINGRRLLVKPGAYLTGFESAELDGVELAVSSEAVVLAGGSTVFRSSPSVVEVRTSDVSFSIVNSDHFLNIHSAVLTMTAATRDCEHVDGLLGQTAHTGFQVEQTADFKQHIETDFLVAEGEDDLWSTDLPHNLYVPAASAQ